MRELREELDLGVTVGSELLASGGRAWPVSASYEMRLWFAAIVDGALEPGNSHDELRWLGRDELGSVNWLDADCQVLPYLGLS